ncbi:uncharacterized protein LOC142483769 [Ascaphus truei]|uniref:uncharacterized protein LOC142483769 n=1 Tax=Ascaphus truei TaxID=8439 RepID=UPI003F5945BF
MVHMKRTINCKLFKSNKKMGLHLLQSISMADSKIPTSKTSLLLMDFLASMLVQPDTTSPRPLPVTSVCLRFRMLFRPLRSILQLTNQRVHDSTDHTWANHRYSTAISCQIHGYCLLQQEIRREEGYQDSSRLCEESNRTPRTTCKEQEKLQPAKRGERTQNWGLIRLSALIEKPARLKSKWSSPRFRQSAKALFSFQYNLHKFSISPRRLHLEPVGSGGAPALQEASPRAGGSGGAPALQEASPRAGGAPAPRPAGGLTSSRGGSRPAGGLTSSRRQRGGSRPAGGLTSSRRQRGGAPALQEASPRAGGQRGGSRPAGGLTSSRGAAGGLPPCRRPHLEPEAAGGLPPCRRPHLEPEAAGGLPPCRRPHLEPGGSGGAPALQEASPRAGGSGGGLPPCRRPHLEPEAAGGLPPCRRPHLEPEAAGGLPPCRRPHLEEHAADCKPGINVCQPDLAEKNVKNRHWSCGVQIQTLRAECWSLKIRKLSLRIASSGLLAP